jgi:uncharacterized protein YjiS (DUF1127 family)
MRLRFRDIATMHSCEKTEASAKSCASWTEANAAGTPTGDGRRRTSTLTAGVGSFIARGWRAYWSWRVRRTTILVLHSLDRRTLHDIGVDPSEIESLLCDAGRERRRHYDTSRP